MTKAENSRVAQSNEPSADRIAADLYPGAETSDSAQPGVGVTPASSFRVLVACESMTVREVFRACNLDARAIADFPGYAVTSCGEIFSRNHPTGPLRYFKALKGHFDKKGYRGLTLCNQSGKFPKRYHRLVAQAFHANPDGLPCVRHINGDARDNRASNLAWATYSENEADKLAHGTWGSRFNGKLSADDRAHARALVAKGFNHTATAKIIGVSHATISRLVGGKIWKGDLCAS